MNLFMINLVIMSYKNLLIMATKNKFKLYIKSLRNNFYLFAYIAMDVESYRRS